MIDWDVVQAIRNNGTWPPILEFLDNTGLSAIPMFGRPPVVRDPDGSLWVFGTEERVPVGDWLVMSSGRRLHHMSDEEFQEIRWSTK